MGLDSTISRARAFSLGLNLSLHRLSCLHSGPGSVVMSSPGNGMNVHMVVANNIHHGSHPCGKTALNCQQQSDQAALLARQREDSQRNEQQHAFSGHASAFRTS